MKKLLLTSAMIGLLSSTAAFAMDQEESKGGKMQGMENKGQMMREGKMHHGWMKRFDANNDGNISRAEADAAHNEKFKMMDANADGNISKDEMKAHHEKKMGERKARREEFMAKFDTNKDGKIDDAEKQVAKEARKAKMQEMKGMRDDGKPTNLAPSAGK